MKRTHVVILGVGYAGLCCAHKLQNIVSAKDVEITLVDRRPYHVNMINLHEIAVGNSLVQDISFDIIPVLDKPHARVVEAEVTDIDKANKKVITSAGEIPYDILVIGLGFVTNTFGVEGVNEYAYTLESIRGSQALSRHIEECFRRYSFAPPAEKDPKDLTFLVAGAGFTGIELLGELSDRLPKLCRKYRIPQSRVRVQCFNGKPKILPQFNDDEVNYIKSYLSKFNIEFVFGGHVVEVKPNAFVLDRDGKTETFEGNTLIWTTGVTGSPVMAKAYDDSELKNLRLAVNQDLTDPNDPNIYVLGDCASLTPPGAERPLPQTAQLATQMGYHAAQNIKNTLNYKMRRPFHYSYKGTVCSLGKRAGVADLRGITIKGFWAIPIKRLIEAVTNYKIAGISVAVKYLRVLKLF